MTDTLTKDNACCQTSDADGGQCSVTYSPRFDIWETEDELVVYGDLPGVAPEDLDIRFENRDLTIHGKVGPRNKQANCEDKKPPCGEYGIGDFYRTFSVAETIDADNISAELNNGVLTLHLPKTEDVKPRRIQVTS